MINQNCLDAKRQCGGMKVKRRDRERKKKKVTLRAGFEPARGDPIGFQVQRLNHSAITAHMQQRLIFEFYAHNILVRG